LILYRRAPDKIERVIVQRVRHFCATMAPYSRRTAFRRGYMNRLWVGTGQYWISSRQGTHGAYARTRL